MSWQDVYQFQRSEAQTCMLAAGVVSLLLLWFAFTEDNPITAYLLGLRSGPPGHNMTKFLLKEEIGILNHVLYFA